jgi:hypothetical protein
MKRGAGIAPRAGAALLLVCRGNALLVGCGGAKAPVASPARQGARSGVQRRNASVRVAGAGTPLVVGCNGARKPLARKGVKRGKAERFPLASWNAALLRGNTFHGLPKPITIQIAYQYCTVMSSPKPITIQIAYQYCTVMSSQFARTLRTSRYPARSVAMSARACAPVTRRRNMSSIRALNCASASASASSASPTTANMRRSASLATIFASATARCNRSRRCTGVSDLRPRLVGGDALSGDNAGDDSAVLVDNDDANVAGRDASGRLMLSFMTMVFPSVLLGGKARGCASPVFQRACLTTCHREALPPYAGLRPATLRDI